MLKSVHELQGFAIAGADGEVGELDDLYFDDERWAIRYFVVRTGGWLGRDVLVTPLAVKNRNWDARQFTLSLTRRQIKESPDVDLHQPVSRQYEERYFQYYGYPYYWGGAGVWGSPGLVDPLLAPEMGPLPDAGAATQEAHTAQAIEDASRSHLRSAREVTGYHIAATDGDIGHVDDLILDDASWTIRYLRVDTSNWPGGKPVLIAVDWARRISFTDRKVHVDTTKDAVRSSPEFDPRQLNRDYELRLHAHYGRRGYWTGSE